jgi:hypothetical protein
MTMGKHRDKDYWQIEIHFLDVPAKVHYEGDF